MHKGSQLSSWTATRGIDAVAAIGGNDAVVATYALEEEGVRCGGVVLVRAGCDDGLHVVSEVGGPGVLDLANMNGGKGVLGACSDGTVRFFGVGAQGVREGWVERVRDGKEGPIVLSVDMSGELLGASDADGGLYVLRVSAGGCERVAERADVHAAEAWSMCVSGEAEALRVYSGGDDGTLCGWDVDGGGIMFRLRKPHGGVGVTSVVRDAAGTGMLWTGGYDDTLRLWDLRAMRNAVQEIELGGGVWRVKFHPDDPRLMLVATMYDGFKVVRRDAVDGRLRVVCRFDEHKSIAYGAAWMPARETCPGQSVALTGSFYDHSLRLWSSDVAKS